MSQLQARQCDCCGEKTYDRYESKGWIVFSGGLSRSAGRDDRGCAVTDFIDGSGEHDFCSLECLKKHLDAMANVRRKRIAR